MTSPTAAMAPELWRFTRWLPRAWRIALLEALAWPEFEVKRLWLTGNGVERIDMRAGEDRMRSSSSSLQDGAEPDG